jgi:hypothetical protein
MGRRPERQTVPRRFVIVREGRVAATGVRWMPGWVHLQLAGDPPRMLFFESYAAMAQAYIRDDATTKVRWLDAVE